jgi:GT2 family glycosyltransferase
VIAKDALEAGATHLLWIDSDMEFQPDLLVRLLAHDLPMVGVNATMRRLPHNNCARYADGTELTTSIDSTGLEKVDRTGFGVMMLKAEVFQKIAMPWFAFEWMPERHVFMGEDYFFLLKAKAAGYEVVVDQDVSKGVGT